MTDKLLEKLAHQNRERIAEHVVHAKGRGAFGPSPSPLFIIALFNNSHNERSKHHE
jgi:hypothetical protein